MYTEEELLPISALQHLQFCERQWALIHLEGLWADNLSTMEGHILHDRAHEGATETRGDLRIARGLRLRSLHLGLTGKADVVEFHKITEEDLVAGIPLCGISGLWKPLIVEYKRGRPKIGREDEIQLCAQVMCLEEMVFVSILSASFFYGKPRRRYDVAIDEGLRSQTESMARRLHELTRASVTPAPEYSKKCRSCSLVDLCLPKALSKPKAVNRYLSNTLLDVEGRVL